MHCQHLRGITLHGRREREPEAGGINSFLHPQQLTDSTKDDPNPFTEEEPSRAPRLSHSTRPWMKPQKQLNSSTVVHIHKLKNRSKASTGKSSKQFS